MILKPIYSCIEFTKRLIASQKTYRDGTHQEAKDLASIVNHQHVEDIAEFGFIWRTLDIPDFLRCTYVRYYLKPQQFPQQVLMSEVLSPFDIEICNFLLCSKSGELLSEDEAWEEIQQAVYTFTPIRSISPPAQLATSALNSQNSLLTEN